MADPIQSLKLFSLPAPRPAAAPPAAPANPDPKDVYAGSTPAPAPPRPKPVDNPSGEVAPPTPAERKAVESTWFKGLYESKNLQLDAFQPGEGPYQVLERMNKDGKLGKIPWRQEQIQAEALRVSRRDLKGRQDYRVGEQTPRWTEPEIDKRVAENVNRMRGIDVSHHNGAIDWKKVKAGGYEFAFLKASDGEKFVDPRFAENRQGARDAGLAVGYYHFFRPKVPVEKQVENFANTVGKPESDMLRLVIDTEDARLWEPYSPDQRVKMINDFRDGVRQRLGTSPQLLIYGSPSFLRDELSSHPSLARNDLWIANYKTPEPTIPEPWSKPAFWQYSEHGKVPGIDSPDVDLDMAMRPDITREVRRHASRASTRARR